MIYIVLGLLALAIGIAIRLKVLYFKEYVAHCVTRHQNDLDKSSHRAKAKEFSTDYSDLYRQYTSVCVELTSLRERHGQLRATMKHGLDKLEGKGFRRKNTGPLERSAVFKRLRDVTGKTEV